jgi:rod shape-determining protein MreD
MKGSKLLVVSLILILAQFTLLNYLRFFSVSPDLFLVVVFICSLLLDLRQAVIIGAGLGLLKELFIPNIFGINIILYSLWGFLVGKISRKISIEDTWTCALGLFIVALAQNIANGIFLAIFAYRSFWLALYSFNPPYSLLDSKS